MLETTAIYLSSFVTAYALKSALMYPIVGPWRAALVRLGLPVAVIEAEIITAGAATAAAIVKREIDKLRKAPPKK
jgi:hypothetical protein